MNSASVSDQLHDLLSCLYVNNTMNMKNFLSYLGPSCFSKATAFFHFTLTHVTLDERKWLPHFNESVKNKSSERIKISLFAKINCFTHCLQKLHYANSDRCDVRKFHVSTAEVQFQKKWLHRQLVPTTVYWLMLDYLLGPIGMRIWMFGGQRRKITLWMGCVPTENHQQYLTFHRNPVRYNFA